jgi:hypothetical protein
MQIIYTCPKCGSDLEETVLMSYPPQYKKLCRKCGYEYIEQTETIRIPFVEPEVNQEILVTQIDNNACDNCGNNPKNGRSGICHCTLGLTTTC